jgi:hypothetical protein
MSAQTNHSPLLAHQRHVTVADGAEEHASSVAEGAAPRLCPRRHPPSRAFSVQLRTAFILIARAVPSCDVGKPFVSFRLFARVQEFWAMLPQCCDNIADVVAPPQPKRCSVRGLRRMPPPPEPTALTSSCAFGKLGSTQTIPKPFVWTDRASNILENVKRGRAALARLMYRMLTYCRST